MQLGIKWPVIKEYLDTWDIVIVTVVFIGILSYLIYKKRVNTK